MDIPQEEPAGQAPTRERGFGLVELMISITVILFGVLAVFSSEISSLGVVKGSRETNTAMAELQAAMEQILTLPHADIPKAAGPYAPDQPIAAFEDRAFNEERIVATYPGYTGTGTVPDPLTITLTISWRDANGGSRTLSLTSAKTK